MASTIQQVFNNQQLGPVVVAAIVGTGTVVIEKPVGSSWVTTDTITADGAAAYWVGYGRYRVTPTGTAQYEIS